MIHRLVLITCFAWGLPVLQAYAEAPVVDDSENFALLEEQQAVTQPVARGQRELVYNDEQPALAKDDTVADTNDASVLNKIQGLQQDIQELRGQLEMQAHDLKLLQEQQLAFYKDLDARLSGHAPITTAKQAVPTELSISPEPDAGKRISPPSPVPPTPESPQASITPPVQPVMAVGRTNPAEEQISYLAAYDLIKNKHYDDALLAMQTFVAKYPQGGYSANAQYWLGELYMVKKEYTPAIEHFDIVLKQFPSSSKGSACMLKMGYALAATGQTDAAKKRLQEVMKKYPDTNTAQLASVKLATLGG